MLFITAIPLTKQKFKEFGNVLETEGNAYFEINSGMCRRFDSLANVDLDWDNAQASLSIFRSKPYNIPIQLIFVERHPLSSQAFMPLHSDPFLVVVAKNQSNDKPDEPLAFVTNGKQGVSFFKNTWHGVLTPIREESDFLVIDRVGPKANLDEYYFSKKIVITV